MTDGSAAMRQERLRFVGFDFQRLPDGRCRARVVLEWGDGSQFEGNAEELGSDTGQLRCAAGAALQATERAVEGQVTLDLLGVKSVRAFDTNVLIVSIGSQRDGVSRRLVGSFLASDDIPRGAAVAVLNATNRLLGNVVRRQGR